MADLEFSKGGLLVLERAQRAFKRASGGASSPGKKLTLTHLQVILEIIFELADMFFNIFDVIEILTYILLNTIYCTKHSNCHGKFLSPQNSPPPPVHIFRNIWTSIIIIKFRVIMKYMDHSEMFGLPQVLILFIHLKSSSNNII